MHINFLSKKCISTTTLKKQSLLHVFVIIYFQHFCVKSINVNYNIVKYVFILFKNLYTYCYL